MSRRRIPSQRLESLLEERYVPPVPDWTPAQQHEHRVRLLRELALATEWCREDRERAAERRLADRERRRVDRINRTGPAFTPMTQAENDRLVAALIRDREIALQ